MTTADSILALLASEKATTQAISDTLHQPPIVINAFLCDLEAQGLTTSQQIGNPDKGRKLALWSITPSGRDRAASLTAAV
jgi:predicted ArsR family transcriptional regulator